MIFSRFLDDFNELLLSHLRENFFSTVSKCTIRKMIIMINNVNIFAGFQLTVFENKPTFAKKSVLHTTILMHSKARHCLRDLPRNDVCVTKTKPQNLKT